MQIVAATSRDAGLLAELNRAVQGLHVRNVPGFFRIAPKAEIESFFRDLLGGEGFHALVAYEGTEPVGYILLAVRERPTTPFSHARRWLLIDQISVQPEHQGAGYGRALVRAAVDFAQARGISDIEAESWYFNERARGFFRQQGFAPRTERLWLKSQAT